MRKILIMLVAFSCLLLAGCSLAEQSGEQPQLQLTAQEIYLSSRDETGVAVPLDYAGINPAQVSIEIADPDIAYSYGQMIIGINKGQTVAHVTYQDQTLQFRIIVQNPLPVAELSMQVIAPTTKVRVNCENYYADELEIIVPETEAEIDSYGYIVPKVIGTIRITVQVKGDPDAKQELPLYVLKELPTLTIGETHLLVGQVRSALSNKSDDSDYVLEASGPAIEVNGFDYVAKAPGEATLTLYNKHNALIKTSVTLEVHSGPAPADNDGEPGAGNLLFDLGTEKTLRIKAGENRLLPIKGLIDPLKYRWQVDNTEVATVTDSGVLWGCKAGQVRVSVFHRTRQEVFGSLDVEIYGENTARYGERIYAAAESQLGYAASYNKDNRFGRWYKMNYVDWCAIFVSWCLNQSGVSEVVFERFMNCQSCIERETKLGTYHQKDSGYVPRKGDIIFFDWEGDGRANHTGIVEKPAADGDCWTIEGNTNDDNGNYGYGHVAHKLRKAQHIVGYATNWDLE